MAMIVRAMKSILYFVFSKDVNLFQMTVHWKCDDFSGNLFRFYTVFFDPMIVQFLWQTFHSTFQYIITSLTFWQKFVFNVRNICAIIMRFLQQMFFIDYYICDQGK